MDRLADEEIYSKIESIIINQTGVSQVTPNMKFYELEMDSLDMVEVCIAIEQEFGIKLDDQVNTPNTPAGLTRLVKSYLNSSNDSRTSLDYTINPCPFCGNKEPKLIGRIKDNRYVASVVCNTCNARGPEVSFSSYSYENAIKVINLWNTRKSD